MARTHGNRQKHESSNPLQRLLIARFHAEVVRLVRRAAPADILEIGCGEGYVLNAVRRADTGARLRGVDLAPEAIAMARDRVGDQVGLEVGDARALPGTTDPRPDLVMMLEVLEHLDDPRTMLADLRDLTGRWVLLSVPWEPHFRGLNLLRLKHLRAWGNDPAHVNHWGRAGFVRFVETAFTVREKGRAFPWTLVLAEGRPAHPDSSPVAEHRES